VDACRQSETPERRRKPHTGRPNRGGCGAGAGTAGTDCGAQGTSWSAFARTLPSSTDRWGVLPRRGKMPRFSRTGYPPLLACSKWLAESLKCGLALSTTHRATRPPKPKLVLRVRVADWHAVCRLGLREERIGGRWREYFILRNQNEAQLSVAMPQGLPRRVRNGSPNTRKSVPSAMQFCPSGEES